MLRSHYVSIRNSQRLRAVQEGASNAAVPITVRQLEAIVRISESLAKLTLSREATPEHVAEAIRLFKVSTGHAANSGSMAAEGFLRPEMATQIQEVEDQVSCFFFFYQIIIFFVSICQFLHRLTFSCDSHVLFIFSLFSFFLFKQMIRLKDVLLLDQMHVLKD